MLHGLRKVWLKKIISFSSILNVLSDAESEVITIALQLACGLAVNKMVRSCKSFALGN